MGIKESLEKAYNLLVNYLDYNYSVINMFHFGSRVYGSNNEDSDYDFIAIVNALPDNQSSVEFKDENISIQLYTESEFKFLKESHDIQYLEICSLDPKYKYHDFNYELDLDLWKLRKAISTVSSNSWVKGKKKLIISSDYDLKLAIKSTFHSLRILNFGTQIANSGKIENFSVFNFILEDLYKLSKEYSRNELWDKIDNKYRSIYNSLNSTLKQKCPKKEIVNYDLQLDILMKKFKVTSENNSLFKKELMNIINNI